MVRHYRKVIKVQATDSPNVRYALYEQEQGRRPSGRMIIPGVLSWQRYQDKLATYDEKQKTVGLDANFYEGREVLLVPPDWLDRAVHFHQWLVSQGRLNGPRVAEAVGVDSGEGQANTAWAAVDHLGIIEIKSLKTPNTAVIPEMTLEFARRHGVYGDWHKVLFDRGGGGKQHADRLRDAGYGVRTVGFGESVSPEPRRGMKWLEERLEEREERGTYANRRAQIYGLIRERLDPNGIQSQNYGGWAVPPEAYQALRDQICKVPLEYDEIRRLIIPPKSKREGSHKKTLIDLIGYSPDETEAVGMAVYGMTEKASRVVVGVE